MVLDLNILMLLAQMHMIEMLSLPVVWSRGQGAEESVACKCLEILNV